MYSSLDIGELISGISLSAAIVYSKGFAMLKLSYTAIEGIYSLMIVSKLTLGSSYPTVPFITDSLKAVLNWKYFETPSFSKLTLNLYLDMFLCIVLTLSELD